VNSKRYWSHCKAIRAGVTWSNFAIWKITLAAAFWTFCKQSSWYFGRANKSALQSSGCEDTKAWISVFGDCTVRNFLICLVLHSPRKALLQILPMWTFIRIWASNQDPRFRTLSKGLMTVSPIMHGRTECSTRYLKSECSEWVGYRGKHEKRNSTSPSNHALSCLLHKHLTNKKKATLFTFQKKNSRR